MPSTCDSLTQNGLKRYVELGKHPYRYDLDIMNTVPDEAGVEKYCLMTLADEPGGSNRYLVNRGGYIAYSTRYPLHYFKLKLELYECLAALHAKRVNIAREWLVNNKLLAPTPVPVLRPHSPEWFAALEVEIRNRRQSRSSTSRRPVAWKFALSVATILRRIIAYQRRTVRREVSTLSGCAVTVWEFATAWANLTKHS